MNDEELPPAPFPWKALATNAAAIGGGHLLGHLGAGAAVHLLASSPLGHHVSGMSPERLRSAAGAAAGITGGLAAAMVQARHMAATQRLQEEMLYERRRLQQERLYRGAHEAEEQGSPKVASVYLVYAGALGR